jgi:hypothetical protein
MPVFLQGCGAGENYYSFINRAIDLELFLCGAAA